MKKIIVYGLGNIWDSIKSDLEKKYEIVGCVDRDPQKRTKAYGYRFFSKELIVNETFDYIVISTDLAGVQEELCLELNMNYNRVLHYKDALNDNYKPSLSIGNCSYIDLKIELSIIIPTYNRKQRLIRTLKILDNQTDKDFKVIILDNASSYDIDKELEKLNLSIKYRVIHNMYNIGMCGNLSNAFVQVNSGWIWTLSDDDAPKFDAVEKIKLSIYENQNAFCFLFSIHNLLNDNYEIMYNIHDLTTFYETKYNEEKSLSKYEGDFIFFSNKVYSVDGVKSYIEKVFTYSYTAIPHIIPILCGLSDKIGTFVISNYKIVEHDSISQNHWNWLKTALGMRTITDLVLDIGEDEKRVLYRLIMIPIQVIMNILGNNPSKEDIRIIRILYNDIYTLFFNKDEREEYEKFMLKIKGYNL